MCANLQFKEGILGILRQSRRSFILRIIGATGLQHVFSDCTAERKGRCLITKHLVPAGDGFVAPCFLGYTGASDPTEPTDPAEYKMAVLVLLLGAVLANDSIIVVYWILEFASHDGISPNDSLQRFPPQYDTALDVLASTKQYRSRLLDVV